jgi:prepilin-type N-terminal cleavage/methylation domain-containing protein
MRPPLRDRSGYTLLELLLVMVIMAILAAITYVRIAPALERARVRGAASVLATDLQYAQVQAARYRTPMQVVVDVGQKKYLITDLAETTIYRERDFGDDGQYSLDSFTASPVRIYVFPNAIVDQSALYTVGLNGYQRQVSFSRAGQVRVSTP